MILGITGGSGCGKTTALRAVEALGGMVLDCDAIYHRLLERDPSLLANIDARFPGVVEKGVLDRKKLGSQVFADPDALLDLNRIAHGAVRQAVEAELDTMERRGLRLAAIDAIALFESGLSDLCHHTIAVTAPLEHRVARLMARDGISREYALSRIQAQKSNQEFSAMADITMTNDGGQQEFYDRALSLIQGLLREFPQPPLK